MGITLVFTLKKLFCEFTGNKNIAQGIEKRGIQVKFGVNDLVYHVPEGLPAIRVFLAALRTVLCLGWQRIMAIVAVAIGICRLFRHDGVKIRRISEVRYMFLKISFARIFFWNHGFDG